MLVDAGLTGELPVTDPPDRPTFGVFLADRTYLGSKLSYYLSGRTRHRRSSEMYSRSSDSFPALKLLVTPRHLLAPAMCTRESFWPRKRWEYK